MEQALRARAQERCELCGDGHALVATEVPPAPRDGDPADGSILLCAKCADQTAGTAPMDAKHWFCLQEAAWSEIPVVVVCSWRLLQRLSDEAWARDLLDQLYLSDETMTWARATEAGDDAADPSAPPTLDSNGAALSDGDSVTLIKALDVKGTGFVAKRGTQVKNIRLTDNPAHVEGRVNNITIVLKTCFLKRTA